MKPRVKLFIGVVIIGIICLSAIPLFKAVSKQIRLITETKDSHKQVKVVFPIDTEEEAIAYAKTFPEVKKFIERWEKEGFKIRSSAWWYLEGNRWVVGFDPLPRFFWQDYIYDVSYEAHFKPDGTIISVHPRSI